MTPDQITFTDKTGHVWIDRRNMPQIDSEHLAELQRFAISRGIKVTDGYVRPITCSPAQYISPEEMDKPLHGPIDVLMKKPVLLAKDHTIIDGNHRWAAWIKSERPWMPALIFDAHFHEVMEMIWKFPFTYRYGDGRFHAHIN